MKEALALSSADKSDVVLLDLDLPDCKGLAGLEKIQASDPDLPVIVLTGLNDEETGLRAVGKNAQDYLVKGQIQKDLLARSLRYAVERKRIETMLQTANQKLKELSERKSAFVANISHEIRNPLAIIRESMDLALEGVLGETTAEQREYLGLARKNIDRLLRLLSDLLDISKIEAGRVEINRGTIDIPSFMNELLIPYLSQISRKRMTLQKNIPPDIGTLWADRDKLSQVVINLLNNAIKYTPDGGKITVKISGSDGEVCFEIADTGPGIPKEYFKKIFDKFERITAEKKEGTGLGLAITKDIIELHKGRIWIESETGKGSRFLFTLPRGLREIEAIS
jgi:signal transduction histidine kinase